MRAPPSAALPEQICYTSVHSKHPSVLQQAYTGVTSEDKALLDLRCECRLGSLLNQADRRRLALFDQLHAFFRFSRTVQYVLSGPPDRLEELMEVEEPVAKLGVPLRLGRRMLTRRHSDLRRCERAQS